MIPFVRTGYEDFLPDLQKKWNQAFPYDTADIFKKIVNKHTQKGRYYHNLSHLHSMLLLLDEYPEAIEHKKDVQLSIFFHDIIYDATKKGNEENLWLIWYFVMVDSVLIIADFVRHQPFFVQGWFSAIAANHLHAYCPKHV